MKTMARIMLLSIGLIALPLGSHASQMITTLNRDQFQAALVNNTGISLQDFDSFASGTVLDTDGAVSYSTTGGSPLVTDFFLNTTAPNSLGATDIGYFQRSDTLTLEFNQAITAFALDINTFASTDGSYSATLNDGSVVPSIFDVFPNQTTGEFIGFVAENPFNSVTVSANTGFAYTVDTLEYGQASQVMSAAPEPSTWLLMFVAIGAIGLIFRRDRQVARPLLNALAG